MIKIFHHNDLDGKMSAALAYEFYNNRKNIPDEEIELFEVDYTMDIEAKTDINPGDYVLFLDYSFSSNNNINFLIDVINKKCNVLWIDHHISSKRLLTENKELIKSCQSNKNNVNVVINIDYCAAYITYIYFNNLVNNIDTDNLETAINQNHLYIIPKFIEYVNSYDVWKYNIPNTQEFILGLECIDYDPKNILDKILSRNDTNKEFMLYDYSTMSFTLYDHEKQFIEDIIDLGKKIRIYKDKRNEKMRKNNLFNFSIILHSNQKDTIYKGIAINGSGDSLLFGEEINNYDIACVFIKTSNGIWKYSLYSSDKSIDCSSLASIMGCYDYLGGGGHKSAAGFQTNKCIFDIGKEIHISAGKFKYQIDIK